MHSQAQCFLTSNIFLSQLTQHYVFMDKFFLQSRSNPWEYHLASNETRFLKGPAIPRAEALRESYQLKHCALHQPPTHVPKHTCTAAGHSVVPPPHGFLHGHTSYCRITGEPGCLPQTNAHMPLFGNPRVTRHQQPGSTPPPSSDALLFVPCL